MVDLSAPEIVPNQLGGEERLAFSGRTFEKIDPATGRPLCRVAQSDERDVRDAVTIATAVQPDWASETVVRRGEILRATAVLIEQHRNEVAALVASETGKSPKDAFGEVGAAIEMGFFVAGEGRRFYGKTTTSGVPGRSAMIMRQPLGVAGLIIAANTPIANVAWKAFPALLCGNAAILKASEDAPLSAWAFARLLAEAGAPPGVLQIVHGYGPEAGAPLVEHPDVALVSFTGSCGVGRWIAETAGRRLAKVCLNRTGFLGDLIAWEDGVYGTSKSGFSGSARTCRPDGRGAPGGPRLRVGGAAVGGAEARLHGGDAAEVGAAGAA